MTESPAARGAAPRAAWSERAVDGVCIVFALWTLSVHASVATGGSLWVALALFAGAGAAWGAIAWRLGGHDPRIATPVERPERGPADPRPRLHAWLRAAGLVLGVGGALALRNSPVALWWWALVLLGAAWLVFVVPEAARVEAAARGRGLEWGLWALALACVAVALASHRIDIDDAFYVNLAVAAADAPGARLLAGDTLHGVAGLPLHHPAYLVHSYELWNGALARLTGLPAIACFHLVSAAVAALMVPLSLARLLRRLTPRHWLWAVGGVLWLLLAAGDVHRWYGNFAFVRIWQGKAIFLFVFLPLVYAYAIELVLRPGVRHAALLAAAQIAALGCSSSAVWAAPLAALLAAACVLRPGRPALLRLGLVVLCSIYVLGVGLGLKQSVVATERDRRPVAERTAAQRAEAERKSEKLHRPGSQLDRALELVTGGSRLRVASLAVLLAAWACCAPGLGRRFAVVVPLGATLLLLDPYATQWLGRNVVGPSYWRSLWALPIPLLMALVFVAPLDLVRRPWLGRAAVLLAMAGFAALVPQRSALSRNNGVELGLPRLKVPQPAYRLAGLLSHQVPPGSIVVAPAPVSVWLPTFHDRVYPLVVRPAYLRPYKHQLGRDDLRLRTLMTRYVAGETRNDERASLAFALGLDRYDVRAVLLYRDAETAAAHPILRAAGFEPSAQTLRYEIWVRD